MMYNIKDGYIARKAVRYFNDTRNTDTYQDKIYRFAHNLVVDNKYTNILDIGCGSGFKLMKYFSEFDTTGVDVPQTVKFLEKKYPDRRWLTVDIENDDIPVRGHYDMILAIDIIEHLHDPDILLKYIESIDFKTCIVSTPERDIARGVNDNGPPKNPHHIREWNSSEFIDYISTVFNVAQHKIVSRHEQFVVCSKEVKR